MKNSGYEYRENVEVWGAGLSLSAYLAAKFRHSPENVWRERIARGEILCGDRLAREDIFVRPGQRILWRRPPWEEPDAPLTYSLLYEDADLLAVAKPSGLPTLPAGGFLEHTLLFLVRKEYPGATPVHRLGRGTSGAVLFARNVRVRSRLAEALRKNEIIKIYRALATGVPEEREFPITAPIGPVPHPKLGTVHAVCAHGKSALSLVRVLEERKEVSVLEVRIETGRPHQIRIHLAFAGHPLAGDPLYGVGGVIRNPDALPGDCGYMLHAERLHFRHPTTGAVVAVYCVPPSELEKQ